MFGARYAGSWQAPHHPPEEPDLRLGDIDGQLVLPLMATVKLDMSELLDTA